MDLAPGIYEALLDESLLNALENNPELRTILGKIEPEEEPSIYASFLAKVIEKVLVQIDSKRRLELCNNLLEQVANINGIDHFPKYLIVEKQEKILLEITPPQYGKSGLPRPHSPLSESSLFTGSPREPQLAHELYEEMRSADGIDILVSFIKWSGLRLLMPAFEDARNRNIPIRLLTTSYMGASDPMAVEWLGRLPNVEVRVSYDTERTRLHAKAYLFRRNSGYSTAYIGSANMSQAAITSGLEWNIKITAQDMKNILEKFSVEFETYWNSREFIPFDVEKPEILRRAIARARNHNDSGSFVYFDLKPHPFQERILDSLERERLTHGRWRNLVIAATGTGKTVIAAFDFKRFYESCKRQANLLFVAHRQEILQQALFTFRNVLRDQNFGELLVGTNQATKYNHLFCSIQMLSSRELWDKIGKEFYNYIVIDEVHHGTAASYRPIFDNFAPRILLGLTATPERMDGGNVFADFDNRFAAEIRLPEALDEKLLCPFHYFGVADSVSLNSDNYWKQGKYDITALENVYVLDSFRANERVGIIIDALNRYEPEINNVKGIGFCVSIKHAVYMAERFSMHSIKSAAFVSGVNEENSRKMLQSFRNNEITFLFTVDRLSEGIDVPEVNTVLFLRPTESLTVFLQQLGRGLRHAPGKDCLTVLDFVGQIHRRYRIDTKLKSLLPRHRFSIDKEVESNFPHMPAGCSIQLDRISREYVLENIRTNIKNISIQIPERIQTFINESGQSLNFGNFITYYDYEPEELLIHMTWTEWKAKSHILKCPEDPDIKKLRKALMRAATINGPSEARILLEVIRLLNQNEIEKAVKCSGLLSNLLYYRIWGEKGSNIEISTIDGAFKRLANNHSILADLEEILTWSIENSTVSGYIPELSFPCSLELHAQYGIKEIQAILGTADISSAGQTGVGVLHFPGIKVYVLLVTFQKTEREFSPSTMYADYPISRDLLHWESQANTEQKHLAGQNLIYHKKRGYTVLLFSRDIKKRNKVTVPFTYLGPLDLVQYEGERPIKMIWRLSYQMPVEIFEDNRRGG